MDNSTLKQKTAKEETLAFLRTFARLYQPYVDSATPRLERANRPCC